MRKRLTALLLSFVMLLTMLPVTVSAEGAEETGGGTAAVICNDQVIATVREFPVHPQFPGGLEGQRLQQ